MSESLHKVKTYFEDDIKTVAQVEIIGESDKVLDLGCSTCYVLVEGSGQYISYNEDGSAIKTIDLNRAGQTFMSFRGVPYRANGNSSTGMKVVALSYPPFDPTAVSVVE